MNAKAIPRRWKPKGPIAPANRELALRAAQAVKEYVAALPGNSGVKGQVAKLGDHAKIDYVIVSAETSVSSGSQVSGNLTFAISAGKKGSLEYLTLPGFYVFDTNAPDNQEPVVEIVESA
jgi:hypothetical protein